MSALDRILDALTDPRAEDIRGAALAVFLFAVAVTVAAANLWVWR